MKMVSIGLGILRLSSKVFFVVFFKQITIKKKKHVHFYNIVTNEEGNAQDSNFHAPLKHRTLRLVCVV